MDNFDHTGTDTVTDCTAFNQHITLAVQLITFHHLLVRADGFRTRLNDIQFAVVTVFRPLDVHRTTVVFFNGNRLFCQFFHFAVGQ